MLPKAIVHFYFWYFIIPSHQIKILHCKLNVIFVMVTVATNNKYKDPTQHA
jgi:hypothetical protein